MLKGDIRKFFANIDHNVLKNILEKYIPDQNILWLLNQIIDSFNSIYAMAEIKKGLPLGNLTSQLFVNIYMNQFDQFIKHKMKAKHYIRYADDFVIMSENKNDLFLVLRYIVVFLQEELKLELHPDKVYIKTLASGVDFLGWVIFPDHKVLRTATKRKMLRGLLAKAGNENMRQSYLGLISYGNTKILEKTIKNC